MRRTTLETRSRYSDRDLIRGLRTFADIRQGRAFTSREFDAWPKRSFAARVATDRFGSWRECLWLIGIHDVRPGRCDPAELMDNLDQVWKELGRPPGRLFLARRGRFSWVPYVRHWGSLPRARKLLAAFRNGEITRDQLLRGDAPGVRMVRKQIPISVRYAILKRDAYRCALCGRSPATDRAVELHIDHTLPVHRGGTNDPANLRTLCRDCNLAKAAS